MGASEAEIELRFYTHDTETGVGPDELAVASALTSQDKEGRDAHAILDELMSMSGEDRDSLMERLLDLSDGAGHGSVADAGGTFSINLANVTRATTLFLCGPEYISHLQQSMRFVKAGGYTLPEEILESGLLDEIKDVLAHSFSLYFDMKRAKLPTEDCRSVLPLAVNTQIISTLGARELLHAKYLVEHTDTPSLVKEDVRKLWDCAHEVAPHLIKERKNNLNPLAWYPSSTLFGHRTGKYLQSLIERDNQSVLELVNYTRDFPAKVFKAVLDDKMPEDLQDLKHVDYTFKNRESVFSWHQDTRQRTKRHTIESIYDAIDRRQITFPPSIKESDFADEFIKQNTEQLDLYDRLCEQIPRSAAVMVIPHTVQVYVLSKIDGFNALHALGKRACRHAQWEIRNFAHGQIQMIREATPEIGNLLGTQAQIYGKCPEAKPCKTGCPTEFKLEDYAVNV